MYNIVRDKEEVDMELTKAMVEKGYKFFICSKCGKEYPAKEENPKNQCLMCLQTKP